MAAAAMPLPGLANEADPIPEGMCRLVLEAHDVFGDGSGGVQWILDSDHNTYNETFFDGFMYFGDYSNFEYMIPGDAEAVTTTDKVVVDGVEELLVPAGCYDWMMIHPDGLSLSYIFGEYALADDFPLLEGKTYRMLVEYGSGSKGEGAYVTLLTERDLAISALDTPLSGVGLTDSENIGVTISNLGSEEVSGVKVSYSINGGVPVTETIQATIKPGDNYRYTFAKKADFSALGNYAVTVSMEAEGDMLPANNAATSEFRHMEAVDLPYNCDFSTLTEENFSDHWILIDGDGDGNGWLFNSYFTNKDGNTGAAGCIPPFMDGKTGDDWMISKPLTMGTGTHNVTFSIRTLRSDSPETIEVCVGKTPYPDSMTPVGRFEVKSEAWLEKALNFDIEEAGAYYVAFRGVSSSGGSAQYIGNVGVAAGEFVGTPVVEIEKVILPVSNACLPSDARIGLSIKNNGTGALSDYKLTAYVGGKKYVKESEADIMPDETREILMDETFDFSLPGDYEVQLVIQNDVIDEMVTKEVTCYEPLDELPIYTNFSNEENSTIWHSLTYGAWAYEKMFQIFSSQTHGFDNGLLCQGFTLEHPVRVKLDYMGGGFGVTGLEVYFGKAGEDPKTYKKIYSDDNVVAKEASAEIVAPIEEPGCYSILIVDKNDDINSTSHIRLHQATISEVMPHDIRIKELEAPVSTYMPATQISGEGTYYVSVENRGSETMTGVKISALVDGEEYRTSDSVFDIAPGETKTGSVTFALPAKVAGDEVNLSFKVEGNEADGYVDDNIHTLPTIFATEDTRAYENITTPEYGTGANGMPIAFGNVYTFAEDADLTALVTGLAPAEAGSDNALSQIAFNIYSLTDSGAIDRKIYSETRERGEGGMITLDIPDMRLAAGSYYFEVEQLSMYNVGLAYDPENPGICYLRTGEELTKSESYSLCIRAVFGADAKVFASDGAAVRFTSPSYTKGLYDDDTEVAAIVRNAGYEKSDIAVALKVNSSVIGEKMVSLNPYEECEVAFKNIDMSVPGLYDIEMVATADSDGNADNDVCAMEITVDKEKNPYCLDFESCNDFDASGDIYNPRWTTIDRNGLSTTYFWRYEHRHRGEGCGFMAFNPAATSPSMTELDFKGMYAHGGERLGLAFTIDPWSEGAAGISESDVWIISPKLQLGTESAFELYVKTRDLESLDAALEPYRLLISDTDDSPESFRVIGEDVRLAAVEDWELVSADISEYDGKQVYVALQYIGKPIVNTCLMIDDLQVKTETTGIEAPVNETPVYVDGNNIIAPEGSRIFNMNGMEVGANNLASGIYIVRTPGTSVKVTVK